MRNENGDLKIGFAIENPDGHFLSQDGEWEKANINSAYMFLKNTAFAEEIIRKNKIDKCTLHLLVKYKGEIREDVKMLRMGPAKYKFVG